MFKQPKIAKPKPLPTIAKMANFSAESSPMDLAAGPLRPNKLTPVIGRNYVSSVKPFLTGDTM